MAKQLTFIFLMLTLCSAAQKVDTIKVRNAASTCGCKLQNADSSGSYHINLIVYNGETSKPFGKQFCVRVTDNTGNVLRCQNGQTGMTIEKLPAGNYAVMVSADGFLPMEFKGVKAQSGRSDAVGFYLQKKTSEFNVSPKKKAGTGSADNFGDQ